MLGMLALLFIWMPPAAILLFAIRWLEKKAPIDLNAGISVIRELPLLGKHSVKRMRDGKVY